MTDPQLLGAFNGLPVGLYRCTPDGRFLDVNAALVELLGYPDRDALLAVPCGDLYVRPADRRRWNEILRANGAVRDFETQMRRRDGSLVWVRDSAFISPGTDGLAESEIGVMVDVTDAPQARVGDEAVLIGRQGGAFIPASELSKICGTIPYETATALSARVPRVAVAR